MQEPQQRYQKKGKYTDEAVLSVSDLHIAFGSNVVLDGFNLQLHKGECKVVLGRSGSGKSVLIKCIIGLLRPDSGSITMLGKDILAMEQDELDKMRTRIGFLFQGNALYDSMTIRENLEFTMRRHTKELEEQRAEDRIMEALENVGLEHTIDMMPEELSGGMQKRIALARTLIMKPDIILYDEPTSGLDPVTSREIAHLINEIQEKYKTSSIVISHDMSCVQTVADKIIVLLDGKNSAEGTYDELAKSDIKQVKEFFE
jgi:phospholipid/cholesterol/gamma-HCH transport system ATP-binding protein